jgi:hypothetical protein
MVICVKSISRDNWLKPILLILLLIFLTFQGKAAPKVVLMLSLNPETNRPPLRTKKWNINKKLSRIFSKRLGKKLKSSGYEWEIKTFVDQYQLKETLKDPDVHGLFWVSHSGISKKPNGPFSSASVVDYQGRDLAPLFYQLPKHLKFLGLV